MHKDMEERAIVIGVAQTFGQAFIAWVPGNVPFNLMVDILQRLLTIRSFNPRCWQIRP